MSNEFRKENLSNGCIVESRGGRKWIYLENVNINNIKCNVFVSLTNFTFIHLSDYFNNLLYSGSPEYDIVKICDNDYVGVNLRKHIGDDIDNSSHTNNWTAERTTELKKMSKAEIEAELGYRIEIVD